ncbi:4a-hydroxytetrahydrobiopterin dehydratase [Nocardia nova]|uniref:4a-hydroxytetrahydrobiopterin dehydratase n=1 Tax=Nocardia nova TaxID=37330 RepID=UPI0033EE18FC
MESGASGPRAGRTAAELLGRVVGEVGTLAPRDEVLTAEQVGERLAGLTGWRGDTSVLTKDYETEYDTAIEIVAEIGKAAIELDHRPDIDIRWDRLRVSMTTHTAGDVVTELDFLLIDRIDTIASSHGAGSR